MGKTVKKKGKIDSEVKFFLLVAGIILVFIFGLEPMYKFFGKIKTGTLFDEPLDLSPDKPEQPETEDYTILEPKGASFVVCKFRDSSERGAKDSVVTLYYTNRKMRSIVESHTYSGMTDEYSNYIMSEHNKFKEIKNLNMDNHGISVEVELSNAYELSVRAVYLLEKTTLREIKTAEGDNINLYGDYDDDVYEIAQLYNKEGYICNW